MSDIERRATCQCGQLAITASGDPDFVIACNCLKCQQRGGAPFGFAGYYRKDRIAAYEGEVKTFSRPADSGRVITNHFCPDCGTTVYWDLEMRPDHLGIAAGCFADPSFPAPVRTIWTENKHHWVRFPDGLPAFEKAVPET
jgi:hypothetical protein